MDLSSLTHSLCAGNWANSPKEVGLGTQLSRTPAANAIQQLTSMPVQVLQWTSVCASDCRQVHFVDPRAV